MRGILLFPPNWSACVSGPHLALPLLAGASRGKAWDIRIWDLSDEFYRSAAIPPSNEDVVAACSRQDFDALDKLYFEWEDQFRSVHSPLDDTASFGLLCGFAFERFTEMPLAEVARVAPEGTVYTPFLHKTVLPRLLEAHPSVVGVTIASHHQVVPAVELLRAIRAELPEAFVVLGGNVITRLRDTPAMPVFTSLADQTVVFQGDSAFATILDMVSDHGVEHARRHLPRIASGEAIPHTLWPTPRFDGIALDKGVGITTLPYVSTRGCYWGKCHFCAIPAGWSSSAYGGSAPAEYVAPQLEMMVRETGIPRVKFVDEAFPPAKLGPLCREIRRMETPIEWEAYARLESVWEDAALMREARAGGLRKIYLGLEQAPDTNRSTLNKNDHGDPVRMLETCRDAGIKVHLFCMVGYPGTTREDAMATVRFLVEHEELVDTADVAGFRLDRGTQVPGVVPVQTGTCDWATSFAFEASSSETMSPRDIEALEGSCQEIIWDAVPRLLHPLHRVVGHWGPI